MVQPNQGHDAFPREDCYLPKNRSHSQRSPPSCFQSAEYAAGRARTTRSMAERLGRMSHRTSSRILRLTRLRCTAVWPYRGTITPNLGWSNSLGHHARSTLRKRFFRPSRWTRCRSALLWSRRSRGNPRYVNPLRASMECERRCVCGPFCGAGSKPRDPIGCSCEPETRVY